MSGNRANTILLSLVAVMLALLVYAHQLSPIIAKDDPEWPVISISKSERLIVLLRGQRGDTIDEVHAQGVRHLAAFQPHEVFSFDAVNDRIIIATQQDVRLLEGGVLRKVLHRPSYGVLLSPSADTAYVALESEIVVLSLPAGKVLKRFILPSMVFGVALAPEAPYALVRRQGAELIALGVDAPIIRLPQSGGGHATISYHPRGLFLGVGQGIARDWYRVDTKSGTVDRLESLSGVSSVEAADSGTGYLSVSRGSREWRVMMRDNKLQPQGIVFASNREIVGVRLTRATATAISKVKD